MKKPLVFITLAYIAGLVIGHGFLYFPLTVTIITVFALAASIVLTRLGRINLRLFLLITVPCFLGITSYIYSAAYFPADHYTQVITVDEAKHEIFGRIVSPLDRDPDRTSFILAAREVDGVSVSGRMRVNVRDELTNAGYGDAVRVSGRVYDPRGFNNPGGFDYPEYLARNGIYYTVSVKDSGRIEILSPGRGLFRKIQDWRERIRQSFLRSTAGPGSAILQAMVLGEEGGLTDEIRDRFMAAGVTHILSISGSHLGLVAIVCFGLLRWVMFLLPERAYHRLTLHADPKKIAAWLTLLPVTFYALLAGGQTATLRSLAMILSALAALILDRENALMHSLAAAALFILIVSPQAIFDISFQLSYLSVISIGYVVTLWNELPIQRQGAFRKLGNSAALLILISLSASVATGPLVAHYFNQFSAAGIFSNMIVVPFAGIAVVPLGLLSGILSLFTNRLPLPGANQGAADAFYGTVTFFSRLPFAEFHPPAPGILLLILYAVFAISFAAAVRARLLYAFKPLESSAGVSRVHIIAMAASGAAILLLLALPLMQKQKARVSFVDVGQGDCALIELPSGTTIMIDGGGTYDGRFDIGRRVVAPYLWNRGIRRLDLVILSHPHPDHMNGLLFILKKFKVSQLWDNGEGADVPGYRNFQQAVMERSISYRNVAAGDPPYMLGEAELSVPHPPRGFSPRNKKAYAAENNRSLVVRVRIGNTACLFTGDIHAEAETELVRTARDVKCDLLKVPHHGSTTSSTEAFVSLVRPGVAVVTVGKGNRYRQPSEEVITRYERSGASVYRTDTDGAVIATLNESGLNVMPWAERTLQRIRLDDFTAWRDVERKNGRRLGLRTEGT